LLRRHVEATPVVVESFGTLEHGGAPALLPAVRAARAYGIDLRDHRSRPLAHGVLADGQLVIGFEPFHVASAVVEGGAASSRAFLLAELADALLDVPAASPGAPFDELVLSADARRRAEARPPRSLADPVGRSDRHFLELYDEIDRLVAIVAVRLFGAGGERKG
jgi:protein-tyrosine-phosphatase